MHVFTLFFALLFSLLHSVLVDAAGKAPHVVPPPAHKGTPKVNTLYTPKSTGSSSGDDTSGGGSGGNPGSGGDNGSGITTPGGAYPTAAASTASACASDDAACNNCGLAWATVTACADVYYPYWADFDDDEMAACLCYNPNDEDTSIVWVPNQFDVPLDYCTAWAATADPVDLSIYADLVDFCTQVGNILEATSTDWSVDDLQTAAATTSNKVIATGGASEGSGGAKTSTSSPPSASSSLIQPVAVALISLFVGMIILL